MIFREFIKITRFKDFILYDKYLLCIIRVFEFLCSDIDYTCLEFFVIMIFGDI